jgi:hypothetical protein
MEAENARLKRVYADLALGIDKIVFRLSFKEPVRVHSLQRIATRVSVEIDPAL